MTEDSKRKRVIGYPGIYVMTDDEKTDDIACTGSISAR